jgi:S-adenosylmethionine synthetase
VDRSAAYAARHIAKNLVAAGVADQVLVQVAYAIGVAQPVGVFVTTYGTTKAQGAHGITLTDGEIAEKVNRLFDLRPYAIVQRFGLQNPIFGQTAAYGHMGRQPGTVQTTMKDGTVQTFETFTWEKLDYVPQNQSGVRAVAIRLPIAIGIFFCKKKAPPDFSGGAFFLLAKSMA